MSAGHPDDISGPRGERFYHGTRAAFQPGDAIMPAALAGERHDAAGFVYLTTSLDEALWEAETAAGDGPGRVYLVEPTGPVGDAADLTGRKPAGHPSMSCCSREPLRVIGEVTGSPWYHGTRADLMPGDLIGPGYAPNYGNRDRITTYVYFSRTLDAAAWGAELAEGDAPGRIYIVEPTGPIEDDPNLTNRRFRGNPTQSFRSRAPVRVIGEVAEWQGHSAGAIAHMRAGLARLQQLGVEPLE